jgi:hypothetical protein
MLRWKEFRNGRLFPFDYGSPAEPVAYAHG